MANLTSGNTGGETLESLSGDEAGSQLALYQYDGTTPVFNFALARVRYRALITTATNVRVFFRTCPALSVSVDYNLNTTYKRSASLNPLGQPIPILGVQGGNVVTVPFFAEPRVDASMVSMNQQTDQANVQKIAPDPTGKAQEVDVYYGYVLDINQPDQQYYPLNPTGEGPYSKYIPSLPLLLVNGFQKP